MITQRYKKNARFKRCNLCITFQYIYIHSTPTSKRYVHTRATVLLYCYVFREDYFKILFQQ